MKKYFLIPPFVLFLTCVTVFGQTNNKINNSVIGVWSGNHIMLEIFENEAKVEYDCANGKIVKKITLDKNKSFNLSGVYIRENGGPVLINEQPEIVKVFYIGKIAGKKMSLTVKRKDNNKLIGKFTLYYGKEPDLVKCR